MEKILLLVLVLASCKQNPKSIHPLVDTNEEQKIDVEVELPEIHFYGETLPMHLVISDSLAKKIGFKLKRVGGDVINQEMIINAKNNNNKTLLLLNKRYGENWRENFEKETGKKIKYYLILK
ncbi:hypothetical protein [Aquimarina sp. Aq78]|uniref:hypothetical protein n=1 Tax=Aquimarina sp. Aq78 TaxID=1191889 RepID=UPI000D0EA8BE|nr:hypothetical protein [Aquimarina sp. Aq78]